MHGYEELFTAHVEDCEGTAGSPIPRLCFCPEPETDRLSQGLGTPELSIIVGAALPHELTLHQGPAEDLVDGNTLGDLTCCTSGLGINRLG